MTGSGEAATAGESGQKNRVKELLSYNSAFALTPLSSFYALES
jgi:hypothetical protein